jgi:hypothetical protein
MPNVHDYWHWKRENLTAREITMGTIVSSHTDTDTDTDNNNAIEELGAKVTWDGFSTSCLIWYSFGH